MLISDNPERERNMNVSKTTINHNSYRRSIVPIAWLLLIVFDVCLMALAYTQDQPQTATANPQQAITQLDGPDVADEDAVRFEAIDVFVDSGSNALAAYQFELASESPGVEIVGIEGGEHAAFEEPPFYDPKAMNNNRVILAAFNTGDNLPSGRSRVARIHVQLQGSGAKQYRTELKASATTDGQKIQAQIEIAKAGA